jgi:cytochrome P450
VLKNTHDFSSVIAPSGPAAPLPFQPQGSDITPQIEAHRTDFVGGDLLVAYDDQQHNFSRSLLTRLFTPSRLKANEQFMAEYSDQLVKDAVANGGCELIKQIATPFVTMVIADLLGVPTEDRQIFMDAIEAGPPPGSLNSDDLMAQNQPLVVMGMYFAGYVQERRQDPRADILSELANATYPDGSIPDALEIVRLATFLFGAGQDTSAKLLGNTMKFIVDEPGLQDRLRQNPSLIPQLLEEVLRLEGIGKDDRPSRSQGHAHWRTQGAGGDPGDACALGRQSRSAPLGKPSGARSRSAKNQGAPRFRPRGPRLRGGAARACRGADHSREVSGAYLSH